MVKFRDMKIKMKMMIISTTVLALLGIVTTFYSIDNQLQSAKIEIDNLRKENIDDAKVKLKVLVESIETSMTGIPKEEIEMDLVTGQQEAKRDFVKRFPDVEWVG